MSYHTVASLLQSCLQNDFVCREHMLTSLTCATISHQSPLSDTSEVTVQLSLTLHRGNMSGLQRKVQKQRSETWSFGMQQTS